LGVHWEAVVDKYILLILEGTFEQGFLVFLQIGNSGYLRLSQAVGRLPPNVDLPHLYEQWQLTYRQLGLQSRIFADPNQVKQVSLTQECLAAANHLRDRFNHWLQAESFRPIREKWLEKLQPADTIRVIIQTENHLLQKLPWHLWDLMERYPQAEIGLSAPAFDQLSLGETPAGSVGILAILGNSEGIDTQADRAVLQQLPHAQVRLLVEPSRQELSDRLWEQPWDILFFAGHSSSQAGGNSGHIYINQKDSLSIEQLKYALRKALKGGLRLAIFNSCDGLGLARELADLHIPQVIVMREPVPDPIAQTFLKYFLQTYATGEPLYTAMRQARERLQALEDEFPCATWLPVIFQNPADTPPTWQELVAGGTPEVKTRETSLPASPSPPPPSPPFPSPPPPSPPRRLTRAIALTLASTALVAGVRFLGMLQPLELAAFDQFMRLRPAEGIDPRLLVVTINEADMRAQHQNRENLRGTSISDASLSKLLTILQTYHPQLIGLDIYRDFPVDSAYPKLVSQLKQTENLIGICKASNQGKNSVEPPPEIPSDRLGFSDFVEDPGKTVRRQILWMQPEPVSPCRTNYAFSMQLAMRYLAAKGINPEFTDDKDLRLGNHVFRTIGSRTGGYQQLDAGGSQILLNYRATPQIADTIPLSQILTGQVDPNSIKDRIVLIGLTSDDTADTWRTPYTSSDSEPGVFVQAHMISQMLSSVLDNRPLLWVLPQWQELGWIWVWSLLGGFLVWRFQSGLHRGIAIATSSGILVIICFVVLLKGGWLPLVPALLVLVIGSLSARFFLQE
jgi:CHASE2 domain-containing sensor protein